MSDEKICFVVSPIGELNSPDRRRADQVLKYVIAPAVEPLGYKTKRADEIPEPGIITNQILQLLVEAELVVADLTNQNPNVFYELAFRHALGKPFVHLIAAGQKIPFDVGGMRAIVFDHQDLDSVAAAKKAIEEQVRYLETPGAKIESPLSFAADLLSLRKSDDPEQRTLGDVLTALGGIEAAVARLEERLPVSTFALISRPAKSKGDLLALLTKHSSSDRRLSPLLSSWVLSKKDSDASWEESVLRELLALKAQAQDEELLLATPAEDPPKGESS